MVSEEAEQERKQMNLLDLDSDRIYDAIREGVDDAVWRMITHQTHTPCHDFYCTIRQAAEKAFERVAEQAMME